MVDAAVFVLGMLTGAGIAHNFLMVGGKGALAPPIVIIGLIIVGIIGFMGRERLVPAR